VVRLNTKSGVKFVDEEGEEIPLVVEKGEKRNVEDAYYRGETKANVADIRREGCGEPLWVMGNLSPDELLEVYEERMKIERTFEDSKSLLDVQKAMSKKQAQLEITLALVLLAYYGLGLMMGEAARGEAYEAAEEAGKKDDMKRPQGEARCEVRPPQLRRG
jgi:transposase